MDIYISKKCPHCKNLLIIFYNNKYLIQYFNIIDVESNQIPNFITSVPTLVYNEELYFDDRMYNLIESVNQHHLKQNGSPQGQQQHNMGQGQQQPQQQQQQQQPNNMGQRHGPPLGTQPQGQNMNDMRISNLNAQQPNMQQPNMQQPNMQQPNMQKPNMQQSNIQQKGQQKSDDPTKQIEKPKEDGEIEGVCWGEDCTYENISDEKGNNNLMQDYCFLDDGYSSEKPTGPNNSSSTGEKEGRFDNNAYEQMMKSRGGM